MGFTFEPEAHPGLLGTVWYPKFKADPTVTARLEDALDDVRAVIASVEASDWRLV